MIAESLPMLQQSQLSDAVLIATIGGIVTVVTSVVGAYFAYKAKKQSVETHVVAEETKGVVNGELAKWKTMAEKLYFAQGMQQEAAEERGRKDAVNKPTEQKL